jgi:allantoinase
VPATYDLVVRAPQAVIDKRLVSAAVGVRGGTIEIVAELDARLDAAREWTLSPDEVLLPGLVDTHVHVNEPGRTEWEGFASATRAAAAGGITTLVDMPLNSIPATCDPESLRLKRDASEVAIVDVGFWGGAVPANLGSLRELRDAGVWGFKCFLLDSGVAEFPPLDGEQLERAMREIQAFDGLLLVHAEDPSSIDAAPPCHGREHSTFVASRPAIAERRAVEMVIAAAHRTGCRAHIVHLSDGQALSSLARARAAGVRITAETCPHYLTLEASEVPDGATEFKCCPPIRDAANRDALWAGLRSGLIGAIVSDHSPCTANLKHLDSGDFAEAWGGIASLQLSASVVWTAARERSFSLVELAEWMSAAPARLLGLPGKGGIRLGADADFCVFAPAETFIVDASKLHHRNAVSPYHGKSLAGVVRSTWLRGVQLTDRSTILVAPGNGRQILQEAR